MKTTTEIKNYLINTFTDFEGIKTVIVGSYDEVTERTLNDIQYPAIWVMYPFSRTKKWHADIPRWRWKIEALILKHAKIEDKATIQQNFDDCQHLGEYFISKLYADSYGSDGEWLFDDVDDVEEWQPKEQYGLDNCNGWLIPISFLTY